MSPTWTGLLDRLAQQGVVKPGTRAWDIDDLAERAFYEVEAATNGWSLDRGSLRAGTRRTTPR